MQKMVQELRKVLAPNISLSNLMETEPIGVTENQENYLNLIVRGKYGNTALSLLAQCQQIEYDLGRTRPKHFAARTADIDVLLCGHDIFRNEKLIIPHPRILERKFCLQGLMELAPFWMLGETNMTITEHYRNMKKVVRDQKIFFVNHHHQLDR